jgi:hypothetical protein
MLQVLGIASALLSTLSGLPYIRDIFLKKTKPERASWFIWSVLCGIAFFSQLAKGATDSLWFTGANAIAVIFIFLLSLKHGTGGLNRNDVIALIVAGIGLVLWSVTREATIALILVMIVDAAGAVLTMIKSYDDPGSETLSSWVFSAISGLLGAMAVGSWNIVLLMYPAYIFVVDFAIVGAIVWGRKRHR